MAMSYFDRMELYERVRKDLLPLANQFLAICNSGTPWFVEPRFYGFESQFRGATARFGETKNVPATPFSDRHAAYYTWLKKKAKFYTIAPALRGWELQTGRFPGEMTVESDQIQLGAVTNNRCIDAAYLCLPVLERLYQGMSLWIYTPR